MTPSVRHLTFSTAGGAGKAATRISNAVSSRGWDSDVIAATDSNLKAEPFARPLLTLAAAIDNYVIREPQWDSLISLTRDAQTTKPLLPEGIDVFHLHWMNGLIPIANLPVGPDTPVVWTLHDKNPFTGVCHFAFGCMKFEDGCQACPAVRPLFQKTVTQHFEKKVHQVQQWKNLTVVSPSKFLADLAQKSAVFDNVEVHTILNPLDLEFFAPLSGSQAHQDKDRKIRLVVIAADLDDPIKNVSLAVASFLANPRNADKAELLLIGGGGTSFEGHPGISLLGELPAHRIVEVLDTADVLVVPSLGENSPSVVYEATARGVIPYVNDTGGLPEMVTNLQAGQVFDSEEALARLITQRASDPPITLDARQSLASKVRKLSHPDEVGKQYIELYEAKL